jgi:hypothetical protein
MTSSVAAKNATTMATATRSMPRLSAISREGRVQNEVYVIQIL